MANVRVIAVIALTGVFVLLLLLDFADSVWGNGSYDVPGLLFGVIGTMVGSLLGDQIASTIRGKK